MRVATALECACLEWVILISYDGSSGSRHALERAAELFEGEPATVLTVWEPFEDLLVRIPLAFASVPSDQDIREIDGTARKRADETAAEGAAHASKLGMTACPRSATRNTTVAQAILAEADGLGAAAIVMGSRGRTGVKSLLLGSVVHDVIQHGDRTVVVVPSEEVAAWRRSAREQEPT